MEFLEEHPPYILDRHTKLVSDINSTKKIICLHCPYPYQSDFEQLVDKLYDQYDHILIIVQELHNITVGFISRYDRSKISYFICGALNFQLNHSQVHTYMDWFVTSCHFYKSHKPELLKNILPYNNKPFYFDALLGRKKEHRTYAWDYIQKNLKDKGIATYIDDHYLAIDKNDNEKWIWENEGLHMDQIPKFSVEWVEYFGQPIRLSQIVPITIYQQTAYSLVAETNFENHYVFFTEKIVKPILARRLFIIVGNRYSLRTLKAMGFKTFDSIIDESYDDIEPTNQRFDAALNQLKWLCEQDQQSIFAQCREITEHNFKHMMTTDWYQLFLNEYKNYFL